MRLRNAGTIDAAIGVLGQLRSYYEDFERFEGPTPMEETPLEYEVRQRQEFQATVYHYVEWAADAERELRSYLADDDLVDHLVGQSLSAVQCLAGIANSAPSGLVPTPEPHRDPWDPGPPIYELLTGLSTSWSLFAREVRNQSERLGHAEERLRELKEFAAQAGEIVVPDTSALVEGIWFEHFDWQAELALASSARLVIPILVIEELDRLKDRERRDKKGDRARRVLKRLRALCGAVPPRQPAPVPTRTNVTVEVLVDDDWHERRPNNDGEIINQALSIAALTGRETTLVCVDAAMEFRARQRGLRVVPMPTPAEAGQEAEESVPPS